MPKARLSSGPGSPAKVRRSHRDPYNATGSVAQRSESADAGDIDTDRNGVCLAECFQAPAHASHAFPVLVQVAGQLVRRGMTFQHLCAPSQHHDVAPASVTVKMQTHLGTTAYMGKAVGVRAVVDQSAVVLPQKPHRVRLRCPVTPHRREPDHLLVTQTLANPLAEASRRIGKEMGSHAIKARSLAAGPPGG